MGGELFWETKGGVWMVSECEYELRVGLSRGRTGGKEGCYDLLMLVALMAFGVVSLYLISLSRFVMFIIPRPVILSSRVKVSRTHFIFQLLYSPFPHKPHPSPLL